MIPQLIVIGVQCMAIGVSLAKDGEPRANFCAITTMISVSVECGLLYWGGFFECFFK
jgi:hypothetical protein